MHINVHKVDMASPSDVSGLAALIDAGTIDPATIVALIGKTEGNGGANDFTRGFATLSYQLLLAKNLAISPEDVGKRIAFVWSGGTEGVLSPHATILTRTPAQGTPDGTKRLAIGITMTGTIAPEEIGTKRHASAVADAVREALVEAGINNLDDVHYVQVKGPLLTPAGIADADRRGVATATRDPNGSKAFARGAMALGVALGLGEITQETFDTTRIAGDLDVYSAVASTSAGGELISCEILLFGNSSQATSPCRMGHAILKDAIDASGVRRALASAGLSLSAEPTEDETSRIAAIFAKAEASPTGKIRGHRNTMLSDADINYERHARAALGAVIASVTSDTAIFVSGGTEHQCAPGEAPIAAIVRI
ncbi:ring-opening amidohydrolase [Tardiphaga sp. 1201_B9_N1_1]|jgi:cyanuric acid amidohydrolase|uniref:cyanuric acid amidohydrolase n=1 Tax=Tardiphaga TaxID=1395974 RepID=UPI000E7638E1|nr:MULTISPECIES: ring-opening amidohydrolase [Tardiphaga]MDR6661588.1 cyanuric acid amidohydrolase [Tardiphaga robiniae]UFS73762.1 ring-opening amidohydrolase [Tardiphaga sp. 37S4]